MGQRALDELESVVPNLEREDPARRRRSLDPAGAPRRGERRADQLCARAPCLRCRANVLRRCRIPRSRSKNNPENAHALRHHPRQRAPALRGGRQRHAAPVRARVRRRLSRLGAADALLRAALPLHHLSRSRGYHALRRAARSVVLRLRAIPRRRDRGAGSSQDRQGAHLRPVDGRLRDAERRHQVSAARAVAHAGRHRLRLGARRARGVPRRRAKRPRRNTTRSARQASRRPTAWARRASRSR